jgi:mannose-6-phosphate isomerase-like protein (cupin superfamily)
MNPSLPTPPKFIRSGKGQCLELRGEVRQQLLDGGDTNGQLALAHSAFQLGSGAPLHVHTREDEWFFIERGRFDFQIGEVNTQVSAGDFVFGPRFVPHAYSCTSAEGGALYVGVLGAGFEEFFRTVAGQLEQGASFGPAEMSELAATYGVQIGQPEVPQTPESPPLIVRCHEGELLEAFGDQARALVTSESVQGRYSIGEVTSPSLNGPPLHVHDWEDETFLIHSGRYEFQIDDARIQVGEGDVIFAPRGVPHTFRVVSSEPGTFLVLTTPGGFDSFFREAARLFKSGEASPETITELGVQHGIRFLPPSS